MHFSSIDITQVQCEWDLMIVSMSEKKQIVTVMWQNE